MLDIDISIITSIIFLSIFIQMSIITIKNAWSFIMGTFKIMGIIFLAIIINALIERIIN
jgi:hypothetical protein